MIRDRDALEYHERGRRGKLEVQPTKPCATQRDLSLAYTPGVAAPCLEIKDRPEAAYRYTGKGNLVAVISNGTADDLADIAISCADEARRFNVEPRIAMLSFSNFGPLRSPSSEPRREALAPTQLRGGSR